MFPEVVEPYLSASVMRRAAQAGLVEYDVLGLRQFGEGKHRVVDGRPYGGGEGMVLRADVLATATEAAWGATDFRSRKTILLSPQGRKLDSGLAKDLMAADHLVLVCGHYEGIDERFIQSHVDIEVSIGDYVLSGGELPALVLIDWLVRQIPGALGNPDSVAHDSFSDSSAGKIPGGLKYPQYTRPAEFRGMNVPDVLSSGDHGKIEAFRKKASQQATRVKRPDLDLPISSTD